MVKKILEREREIWQDRYNVPVLQYYGDWYEFERYFFIAETLLKCSAAQYSPLPDNTIQVINSGKNFM